MNPQTPSQGLDVFHPDARFKWEFLKRRLSGRSWERLSAMQLACRTKASRNDGRQGCSARQRNTVYYQDEAWCQTTPSMPA